MTTIKPTFDRILVKPAPKSDKIGNLHVPDAAKEPQCEGVVIAVGPGHHQAGVFLPTTLKPGDLVHYGEYHGVDIKVDDVTYKILSEGEVLAVIERSALVTM